MQHSRGICSLFSTWLSVAFFIGLLTTAPVHAVEYTRQMKLSANGETLTLLLRPSRVTADLQVVDTTGALLRVPASAYIGKIKGDDNSWVRLTQTRDSVDGVISRFGKRFRLKQRDGRPVEIKPIANNHDRHISFSSNRSRVAFSRPTTSTTNVSRVAKIAIAVDSKFNAYHNGRGLEYALGLINSVDGIYREEFGLALQVVTAINVVDADADPFAYGNIAIENMLRGFRNFRMRTNLIDDDVSLVHLFTGNKPADEPVGLAWIDTACRTDGYDVGLSTHYKHDVLLVAHEIAHNLGALHDSDTACAASTDKVMWPYISAGTSQHFSSCTVETVQRALARSCHAEVIDLELALAVDNENTVRATVTNTDLVRANPAATLAIDLPEGGHATTVQGDCTANDTTATINNTLGSNIDCNVGTLAPGDESVMIFQLDTTFTDELFANVEPEHFVDVVRSNNTSRVIASDNNLVVMNDLSNSTSNSFASSLRASDAVHQLAKHSTGIGGISLLFVIGLVGLGMLRRL